jgi:Transposase DDE domain
MPKSRRERRACQARQVVGQQSDWERVLARLSAGWEERAREHQAFERRRAVRSAGELLRLVLGAAVSGWGQRLVASWADVAEIAQVSGEAVGKRVRKARAWLSAEVGLLLGLRRDQWVGQPGRAVCVRLVDATLISEPGRRGTTWRAHAVVDLGQGALAGLDLTDQHGAESLVRQPIQPGEIAVADRAHARRTDFGQLLERGTDLVVRIGWQNLPLETPVGDPLDLIAWLKTPIAGPTERPVQVQTPTGPYPLRLIAAPLPPQQAAAARRRCRRAAQKKQRTVDARTVRAAGFVLLVTTLDPTTWPLADVLALYRCRWQIELLFKRLKSIWHLDQLRARDPDAAQAFLLGVILAALLAGDVSQAAPIPLDAWLDDPHRPLSRWRWEALWHDALLQAIRGPVDLLTLQRRLPALRRHLCDPPRRRRQQASTARQLLRSHSAHQERRCA